MEIPIILGQGNVADLVNLHHLLIAGATGSGKSVFINRLITGILESPQKDDIGLILIDPKRVELMPYNNLDCLVTPVVTKPEKAVETLELLVTKMEKRYDILMKNKCKNIQTYNDKMYREGKLGMQYIVTIIDEYADLMQTAGKRVESAVMRLTQLARAAGIHLILATQRPSVNIITGVIKSNFPSKISFATSNAIDSRVILGSVGAEDLKGKGEMLYSPVGTKELIKIQGEYISDDDIFRIANKYSKPKKTLNIFKKLLKNH